MPHTTYLSMLYITHIHDIYRAHIYPCHMQHIYIITNIILDLLITSSPNFIQNKQTEPVISDHLAIIFDVNLKPYILKKPIKKAYQFKAAKISVKLKAKAVSDKFIKYDPTKNDINTYWCTIKHSK